MKLVDCGYAHCPPGVFEFRSGWQSDTHGEPYTEAGTQATSGFDFSTGTFAHVVSTPTKLDQTPSRQASDGYDLESIASTSFEASRSSTKLSSPLSEDSLLDEGLEDAEPMAELSRPLDVCLGKLSVAERARLLLPAICLQAQQMSLPKTRDSVIQLQRLISEHPEAQKRPKAAAAQRVTASEIQELRNVLTRFCLQDLLLMLKPDDAPPSVQLAIDTLACEVQFELAKSRQKKGGSKLNARVDPRNSRNIQACRR